MLRRVLNKPMLRTWVTQEGSEWSDLVIKVRETRGSSAWEVANRICRNSRRTLVGRKPRWLYQENEDIMGKGTYGVGTLHITIEGSRPDTMRDAPYSSYGKSIARQYKIYKWDTALKGYSQTSILA